MSIERTPLTPHLGLEICGLDLSGPLDAATRQAILDAWIDAGVLLFRDAGHSAEEHMRLSEVFGEMEPAATAMLNDPSNPYLMTLTYHPEKKGGSNNTTMSMALTGPAGSAGIGISPSCPRSSGARCSA